MNLIIKVKCPQCGYIRRTTAKKKVTCSIRYNGGCNGQFSVEGNEFKEVRV